MYNPQKPFKNNVLTLIKKTWINPYLKIKSSTYLLFKKNFNYYEVDHTDGIGTKGYYHWQMRTFKNAVIDSLAMNLNDLAMVRAVPYKLQNHIVMPKDDNQALLSIVSALVKECKKRKIAVTGGETSIHNTTDGLDIGITVSGFVKDPKPNFFQNGDVLIGLKSSGLHSNGLTKVREIFKKELRPEFVKPTKIYSDKIMELEKKYKIHGMMHITGGAFTKLKDLIRNEDVLIRRNTLKPQKIFYEIYEKGLSDKEMYSTFNCGVGFVLSVSKKDAVGVLKEIEGTIIGEIIKGKGNIKIESNFSEKSVSF